MSPLPIGAAGTFQRKRLRDARYSHGEPDRLALGVGQYNVLPILLPEDLLADPDQHPLIGHYTVGRRQAIRTLDQDSINKSFDECDILTNCRNYPVDEAPAVYKDFDEVLRSVKLAGLASEVARLKARFVIKDASAADD